MFLLDYQGFVLSGFLLIALVTVIVRGRRFRVAVTATLEKMRIALAEATREIKELRGRK
jgi:hypothetical protein